MCLSLNLNSKNFGIFLETFSVMKFIGRLVGIIAVIIILFQVFKLLNKALNLF